MMNEDRQADAAEYVLGTLDAASRTAIEQAAARDRDLKHAIYQWQDRLLPLAAQIPGATPRPDTWARIAARLPARRQASVWWQKLGLWQGLSAAALALAIGLAIQLGRVPAVSPARYVAILETPQQKIGWVVELADADTLRLRPVGNPPALPAGQAWQFWTKPQGAVGPTSLGLVPSSGVVEVPRDRLPALEDQQLFEVTLEPEYGSPTGRPTGPILAVGRMIALAD
jgi:anti-sigma-K factor RskA